MEKRNLPKISPEKTGYRIRELRKERNLSANQLSIYMSVTEQAIYRWERGERIPNIDNLVNMAYLYDTTIDNIIVLEEE